MNIQEITERVIQGATAAYHNTKNTVYWGGHKIHIGVTNYLIPTIQTLWAWTSTKLAALAAHIKAGPGITFAIAAGLFVTGIAAFKIADRKAYEEDLVAKTAWKALGITAFISATVATSFGIAAIVLV